MSEAAPKKESSFSWLMWWKSDPADITKELDRYHTGGLFHTVRGWCVLAVLLSLTITALLGPVIGLTLDALVIDAALWLILAAFMWRGHRWPFIVGMVIWTLDKAWLIVIGFGAGRAPITQILWWVAYMHLFMTAFRVEQARREVAALPAEEEFATAAFNK